MGATGANGMISVGRKMQSWGQNKIKAGAGTATFGVGGRLARKGIGGTSQWGADKIASSNWATKGGIGSKLALKTLRNIGDSSFDIRNTEMGKKMGMGSGIKGGYKTKKEETEKEKASYAKSLKGDSSIQAEDIDGNPQFEMEADGITRRKDVNDKEIEVMKKRTEVYSENMHNRGIWSTVSGNTAINRRAAKVIEAEYGKKRVLENAQKNLRNDPDLKRLKNELRYEKGQLKDAELANSPRTSSFRTGVHAAEDNLKDRENELKELVEKAKKSYDKAKEDSKT
jgi:hypothetical protein